MAWIWVIGFGVLGISLRFALDSFAIQNDFSPPLTTLMINVFGCVIAGFVFGYASQKDILPEAIRLGIIVGFCGGFTTFSGYGLQFLQLITTQKTGPAVAYAITTPILCLLSIGGGVALSRLVSAA